MGFKMGAFATVWRVEPKSDTWTKLQVSISRKARDSDEYKTEWSGFVDVVGTAPAKKAARLKRGDRIRLGEIDETRVYDKEKGTEYINHKVLLFYTESEKEYALKYRELLAVLAGGDSKQAPAKKRPVDEGDIEAPDLPF